jgi:hypothetical protein
MKLCYKIYYDIVHEVAWEAEKEQGRELVSFFRKGVSSIEFVLLTQVSKAFEKKDLLY